MKSRIFVLWLICGLFLSINVFPQDAKFVGAIQRESDVPPYELPDLLTTFDGKSINSLRAWEKVRRPEIIKFFEENIYGKVPTPPDPVKKSFTLVSEDKDFLEGLCTRREVKVTFSNNNGSLDMHVVVFVPNQLEGPFPAICHYLHNGGVKDGAFTLSNPQTYGQLHAWRSIPLRQLMLRGIAFIGTDAGKLFIWDKGKEEVINGGIADLFFQPGQTNTKDDEWGMMSVWAYGLSSTMDYLETDGDIRSDQVAILGASVGGKTAMWAAANDPRIGMVLSCTAGHAGDALWKRQFGETLDNMCEWLPGWLARNAQNYKGRIDDLPVDQHMLMACVAPRPIYISSGQYDLWADTYGAYLAGYYSKPVYEMYGKSVDFRTEEQPAVGEIILKSSIGYNLRREYHNFGGEDWEVYMNFIEYHFMNMEPRKAHDIYYPNGQLIDHYPNKSGKTHIVK